MDAEQTIAEIERLEHLFEVPDTRPLRPSDLAAANQQHDREASGPEDSLRFSSWSLRSKTADDFEKSLTRFEFLLREKLILRLGKHDRPRTLLIIVPHMVDAMAHWVAPHQAGVVGLQQVGRRSHILHARIKPQVVYVWIENDWHAVVDG